MTFQVGTAGMHEGFKAAVFSYIYIYPINPRKEGLGFPYKIVGQHPRKEGHPGSREQKNHIKHCFDQLPNPEALNPRPLNPEPLSHAVVVLGVRLGSCSMGRSPPTAITPRRKIVLNVQGRS